MSILMGSRVFLITHSNLGISWSCYFHLQKTNHKEPQKKMYTVTEFVLNDIYCTIPESVLNLLTVHCCFHTSPFPLQALHSKVPSPEFHCQKWIKHSFYKSDWRYDKYITFYTYFVFLNLSYLIFVL